MHEAKCTQPRQKVPGTWRRANDANLAAPWALVGYFLDPVLFEMLAKSARLQLPAEPFHVPRWRQASLLSFTLESPPCHAGWAPGIPMAHGLPSADLVASAKWLVRALLTVHPGAAHPEWPELGEALPVGSHSPCWLHSCPDETPERLADWLEHTS